MSGPLIHADADAFFVSVALRGRPRLADRPVVTGEVIVACAGYPARAAGVRAGMGVGEARRICPALVVLPVPEDVQAVSDALFALFDELVPAVEPGSMEEGFLDTSALSWVEAEEVGRTLRRRARTELGIAVSVGLGRTKLMAKMASRAAKPDGLRVITPDGEGPLRRDTPVRELWGVGQRTWSRLEAAGVGTLAALDVLSPAALHELCGTTMARRLRQIADGTDDAAVRPVRDRRTISAETATAGWGRADRSPAELAAVVVPRACHRAQGAGLVAGAVAVLLRPDHGGQFVRRRRLTEPTADPGIIAGVVADLLASAPLPDLDALAVTLLDLVPADRARQPVLF